MLCLIEIGLVLPPFFQIPGQEANIEKIGSQDNQDHCYKEEQENFHGGQVLGIDGNAITDADEEEAEKGQD